MTWIDAVIKIFPRMGHEKMIKYRPKKREKQTLDPWVLCSWKRG